MNEHLSATAPWMLHQIDSIVRACIDHGGFSHGKCTGFCVDCEKQLSALLPQKPQIDWSALPHGLAPNGQDCAWDKPQGGCNCGLDVYLSAVAAAVRGDGDY